MRSRTGAAIGGGFHAPLACSFHRSTFTPFTRSPGQRTALGRSGDAQRTARSNGTGEKSPTEIHSIRYEQMRSILINNYRENKIAELVEETENGVTTTYDEGHGHEETRCLFQAYAARPN
jgi:hypothetical protein